MSDWEPIESAPRNGARFYALNHDGEIWVARFDQYGRIIYRTNQRVEPRKFEVRTVDGEEWMKEDKQFSADNERWQSSWTLWSRLYEFAPTHWMPLPAPPARGLGREG